MPKGKKEGKREGNKRTRNTKFNKRSNYIELEKLHVKISM